MDKYRIDSQKISFHPDRVSQWAAACDEWNKVKDVYPIYVEVAPIGACNHRCTFCSVDYIGYKSVSQNELILLERLKEMAGMGVKSIMFAGEGEPALWKPLPNVMEKSRGFGLDLSMTTNMVPFTPSNTEKFIANSVWIKASINAGNRDGYKKIHQTRASDFDLVIRNLERAVEVKSRRKYKCTLGAQLLLLPDNSDQVVELANILKDIGVDYFVVKPYTQSLYGVSDKYNGTRYNDMMYLEQELDEIRSEDFDVVFRGNTMLKLDEQQQPYDKCYSTPVFWAYIMADGSVYSCGAYLQNDKFLLGNINSSKFVDIWEGDARKRNFLHVMNDLSIDECRKNCRMDEVNRYLWDCRNPSTHVNFI